MKDLTLEDHMILERIIATRGPLSQLNIVAEECIELAEQLDIMLSNMTTRGNLKRTWTSADRENLIDEIADVYIVSQQFLIIYGVDAAIEFVEANTRAYQEFGNGMSFRTMATTGMTMLLKIAINALKLQREYTPDLHRRWEASARGFGIVLHLMECMLDAIGELGHKHADQIIDLKIARLKTWLDTETMEVMI